MKEFPRKSLCGYTEPMSRPQLLILIGILVALSPFVGFPLSWLTWALPVLGLATLVIGISLRPVPTPVKLPSHDSSQNPAS